MVNISVLASRELQPVEYGGSRDSQQKFQQKRCTSLAPASTLPRPNFSAAARTPPGLPKMRPRLASRLASSRASRTAPDHATKIAKISATPAKRTPRVTGAIWYKLTCTRTAVQ
ncbi:hypothetical protein [Arthrobacter sp. Y81]|uniref:hypothetical protein n=1 Tax=Arthrobacter sp. Y81 TaxID=2058897 RepID=UPI0011B0D256|nr:hypothetical protein [Arthrobacter sp. Y81]